MDTISLITPELSAKYGFSSTVVERFWSKVNKTETCWLWTAYRTKLGYGVLFCGPDSSVVNIGCHVLSWLIHNGAIPNNLWVLHNCPGGDNPSCVNPNHLFLGTPKDNAWDAIKKGRYKKPKGIFGEESCQAKLTNEQVREIRRLRSEGESFQTIAEKFWISRSHAWGICARVLWPKLT